MQINPTNHFTPLPERRRVTAAGTPLVRDEADFATAETVQASLQSAPEVRAQEIGRAKTLIDTAVYPPEETIAKIANLMAMSVDWRAD
jgi:hypothetical protein